jgi:UDP-glucose 4-epimerase
MAKCLVVGGNGFLGSHIVDELVGLGHEVSVFDRFSSGSELFESRGVRSLPGDYLDDDQLRVALRGQELLFHFVSTTTPATAQRDPITDIRVNVLRSVRLIELAVEAGVSRVYFASTGGAIYGDQDLERIPETARTMPVSPYAIGKQSIEGYLRYFHLNHGLESTSYRISNPYGPRQHPTKKQGVIAIFLQRIADGLPIEVLGDGSMVRDYIYAADAARMVTATVGTTPDHRVYNIGSGVGTSVKDIVELVRMTTGRTVLVDHLASPPTFVHRSVLDIGRYSSEFGQPDFLPLTEGIRLTWDALNRGKE